MKLKVYSVFDTKAECFGTPFFCGNRQSALRIFNRMYLDERSAVNLFPADYILHEIGDYDDLTAAIEKQLPVSLGNACQFSGKAAMDKIAMYSQKENGLIGNGIEEIKK